MTALASRSFAIPVVREIPRPLIRPAGDGTW
jgi:hypothetical protein